MCNVPGASLSHLGLASNLVAFPSYSKTSDHFQVCTVFNINRDTGVESLPENLSVRIKQCDGGRRRGNGGAGGAGGEARSNFSSAGLFSLIQSAVKGGHYVTSSVHTWPTV